MKQHWVASNCKRFHLMGFLRSFACLIYLFCVSAQAQAQTKTLLVAVYPPIDKIIALAEPEWALLHPDVRLKVVTRQFGDHHTAMTTTLSTTSRLPDLMALEVGYLGRFKLGAGLENLSQPPYSVSADEHKFVPYAIAQARNGQGHVVALPSDIGPGTLLYRTDVLDKSGVRIEDLTHSWESFIEAGVKIKRATGAFLISNARDIKDIALREGIAPGDGLYFDRQNRVQVDSPRFLRAFELARQARRLGLDARVLPWSSDWSEGLRRGRIATAISGAWLAGHLSNWLAPDTRGFWRAAALPGGGRVAFGGNFFAIPRYADASRKLLAWDLARLLTLNPRVQIAAFQSHDTFPALLETHQAPFFEQPIEFLGGQIARPLWRETASSINSVAVHRQDAFAAEVIDSELDNVLEHGKDIRTALADAARMLQKRANR